MVPRTRWILVPVILGTILTWLSACGTSPLLSDASFSSELITPNGDREGDSTLIEYRLSRPAEVSIYFVDSSGNRYTFRDHEPRARSGWDPYSVYFYGIVDGYSLPDEEMEGFTVTRRVLQNGTYTWVIEATDEQGQVERVIGDLVVSGANTPLPQLLNFTVSPPTFTPNRDGISDRARLNVWLTEEVDFLIAYLVDQDGDRHHIPEDARSPARPGEPGLHTFDYDAGVDLGADPPADGTYIVHVEAQDSIGQNVFTTSTLTIQNGGVPRGYIYNGQVEWSSTSILLGETLYFTLTIENDSATPLRTSGPLPGTVYTSEQNYASLGETIQSGVFRVGVGCEDSAIDYPWRWAVGDQQALTQDEQGHLYLPPFTQAVVTGGIRFVHITENRNPQYCWAGLIHEDVEIALVNNRVDPVYLSIEEPD